MTCLQDFSTVFMFLGLLMSVISLSTSYWVVVYGIDHVHNMTDQHDLSEILFHTGLPFTPRHKYGNVSTSVEVIFTCSSMGLVGCILGAVCFTTEMFRVFYLEYKGRVKMRKYLYVEHITGLTSALLELGCVVIYSAALFMSNQTSVMFATKRLQEISSEFLRPQAKPGHGFWLMLASSFLFLLVSIFAKLQLSVQQFKFSVEEMSNAFDHGRETD